jgi:hypothetical protein
MSEGLRMLKKAQLWMRENQTAIEDSKDECVYIVTGSYSANSIINACVTGVNYVSEMILPVLPYRRILTSEPITYDGRLQFPMGIPYKPYMIDYEPIQHCDWWYTTFSEKGKEGKDNLVRFVDFVQARKDDAVTVEQ